MSVSVEMELREGEGEEEAGACVRALFGALEA